MKRLSTYILLALFLIGATGCEEWLDINQNPNDLTESTKELVLTGVTKQYAERQQLGAGFSLLGAWTGYVGHSGGWSGWNNVKSYRIIASDYNGFWDGPYPNELKNLRYVEEKGNEDGNMAFVAVAKIMKAGLFQRLVDTYGDVPYSEGIMGFDGITTPVYDDAQTIYDDLVAELDFAINELDDILGDPGRSGNETIGDEDLINQGDLEAWMMYGNTLKLRILLRQAGMSSRQAYIQTNISSTAALGYVSSMTTGHITGNPGYQAETAGKMNPLYESYGTNYQYSYTSGHQQYSLNVFLHNLYTTTFDPRMTICWLPGVQTNDYNNPTKLGAASSDMPHWNESAILFSEAIYGEMDGDVMVMSTMEADFLIAEAIQRGYLASYEGGDAQDWYEEGVAESFWYYGSRGGLTNGEINDTINFYLGQTLENVDWASSPDKLKAIMYQKYTAGVGVYHYETWADYRRTGFPDAMYGDTDNSMISYYFDIVRPQVPVRLTYPQRELDINSAHANAALDKTGVPNGSDFIMDAKIFWDVN
ncbi:MAG: SusD/RagB family nutrient-binding outer membrane lipoprotein [Bacteroidia bacterium]|nr:MAG: SusD/RagB family nutrient-binding outer membrane lipoprotein [Bacteroidia bacterium]